ncbi:MULTISPECIES: DUF4189 domain-containing protein [Achromobacter]|uniref:DUF4189 domain-containing protein n=1 Tax=Alcaligenes xylosoxydans xylosoxydans TaxID=85698 RepID=A0A424W6D6_ALCXX|nr:MULTISPECIES: DUF4189 domain-containing protein [Achromobacter]MBC9907581.1 DUF4189 domain-containing protein [Achromobacter xylosoxidans]MBD0871359.1 DUF4189 domain-containing protein [Achromobacter xylosoxidans]QNP86014.1 DUF4189 domain-containing protein [Achromobacter xylosoxidans]RPJ88768.1 DUF4189 domain-containing protein [Achromobacter xylosoxidans]WLW61896.1 DUF4189 domain-containing protein [Achromobacter aegrifaciens]
MRALKLVFLLAMLHLGIPGLAQAEQGCPDGFMPNAAGTPGQQCVPIPGQTRPQGGTGAQTAPDQPRWTTRWGAIAYDPPSGSVGIAADKTSKAKAERAALEHCASKGGKGCETNITYYNQCVAVVYGPSPKGEGVLMNSASAETKELAQSLAIETCEKGTGTSCKTFYTGCSYPVRIQ